jgi:hypothetical protein
MLYAHEFIQSLQQGTRFSLFGELPANRVVFFFTMAKRAAAATTPTSETVQQNDSEPELQLQKIRQTLESPPSSKHQSLREAYEKRLLTFSPATYFAKPPSLSPLVCARLGYVSYKLL